MLAFGLCRLKRDKHDIRSASSCSVTMPICFFIDVNFIQIERKTLQHRYQPREFGTTATITPPYGIASETNELKEPFTNHRRKTFTSCFNRVTNILLHNTLMLMTMKIQVKYFGSRIRHSLSQSHGLFWLRCMSKRHQDVNKIWSNVSKFPNQILFFDWAKFRH